jgi:hypothetical protein
MHHEDLTAPVLYGLAWYYLLAAAMNAAAAAYVSYGDMVSAGASRLGLAPKTRRMPPWLIGSFCTLYTLAAILILFRASLPGAMKVVYFLCAAANGLMAVIAGADAAHFSEMKSHGHGEGDPSNPLWTLIWSVAAVFFQAMGITYVLGATILMPQFMRDAVDLVAGPTTFFVGATLAFCAMLRYRRFVANGLVGWAGVNAFLLIFGLSMTDYDFRDIVTKPDNVPIVGLLILVGYFDWYALRRAVINDARIAQNLPTLEHLEPEKTLTWPDLVYTELICMVILTIVLVVWGIALQAPLEQPASSTVAPNPSKAPWYFLGLQEMLVYFDPWIAGVLLPSLIIVGLIAVPYIDTNKAGNGYYSYNDRKFAYITFQYGFVVLWVVLILLGTFLRGPNWNFFGPYEFWDLHKLIPLNNVQLSDMIWIQLMGVSKPTNYVIREFPGILIILGYFLLTPYIMYRFFFKKYAEESGILRFMTLAILMLFMASLPIKMVLRWTLNLKYIVAIPELFFNI